MVARDRGASADFELPGGYKRRDLEEMILVNRRSFLTFGASAATAGAWQAPPPPAKDQAAAPVSPFADSDFGFAAEIVLGASYYRGGDPGKLLAIVSRIKPGDFESAYVAYHDAGVEA